MPIKLCTVSTCYNLGKYCRIHLEKREVTRIVIQKVSEPRKDENKIYDKNRKQYLKIHTFCEAGLKGCTKVSTEIHHLKKRRTKQDRIDTNNFMAVCSACHKKIESDPTMAYQNGLSKKGVC